jgi:hypothetical protein
VFVDDVLASWNPFLSFVRSEADSKSGRVSCGMDKALPFRTMWSAFWTVQFECCYMSNFMAENFWKKRLVFWEQEKLV